MSIPCNPIQGDSDENLRIYYCGVSFWPSRILRIASIAFIFLHKLKYFKGHIFSRCAPQRVRFSYQTGG